jgi:hypothetical protein
MSKLSIEVSSDFYLSEGGIGYWAYIINDELNREIVSASGDVYLDKANEDCGAEYKAIIEALRASETLLPVEKLSISTSNLDVTRLNQADCVKDTLKEKAQKLLKKYKATIHFRDSVYSNVRSERLVELEQQKSKKRG